MQKHCVETFNKKLSRIRIGPCGVRAQWQTHASHEIALSTELSSPSTPVDSYQRVINDNDKIHI